MLSDDRWGNRKQPRSVALDLETRLNCKIYLLEKLWLFYCLISSYSVKTLSSRIKRIITNGVSMYHHILRINVMKKYITLSERNCISTLNTRERNAEVFYNSKVYMEHFVYVK